MKFRSAVPLFALVMILPLAGCGKGSSNQSARELKQAFADTNETAPATVNGTSALNVQVDQVASAIDRKDFVGAVTGLEELRERPGLTDQQHQALANTMVRLQGQLAQEIASGDENAKKAGELLRAKQRR